MTANEKKAIERAVEYYISYYHVETDDLGQAEQIAAWQKIPYRAVQLVQIRRHRTFQTWEYPDAVAYAKEISRWMRGLII